MRASAAPLRRKTGTRLFAVYALVSLVPVLGLGAVLVRATNQAGTSRALAQGREQAAVIMQMAIAPSLDGRDLAEGLRANELARLRRATDLAVYSGSVTALRLRTFAGGVVYSDNGSQAGAVPRDDPSFLEAAGGAASVAVTDAPSGRGTAIRVLQPLVPNATGEATGVLELYLPYAPIASAVRHDTHATYVRLGAGLLVLYVVLAAIAWTTTRRLRRYAEQQARAAMHDPLTGLPNRAAFRAFAADAVADSSVGGALVLLDLNRFKEVNDSLGHHAGDQLLTSVAQRLVASVRTDDRVARLGGDEFGMVLAGTVDHDAVHQVMDGVHRALGVDLDIEGTVITIEATAGVALFPEHGTDVDQLLRDADAAMYQGKRGVRPTVVFDGGADAPRPHTHEIQSELQRALEQDELVLHYQPKIDLVTGEIIGNEALARWQHPRRGLMCPADFMVAVESSTVVGPFARWALRQALRDQQAWRERGKHWTVAVNVSAHNLEDRTFVDDVVDELGQFGTDPADLTLELTETALASDNDALIANIAALAAVGVAVSVDDFGTGTTGLRQLRDLMVREIKLDRIFVREIADNVSDQNLARAIVQLAHGMNCIVVAEGVEDEAAESYLRSIGCDVAQGYLYRRPVPWTELVSQPTTVLPESAVSGRTMEVSPS